MNCDGKVRFVVFEKATFSKLVAPKSHNENLRKEKNVKGLQLLATTKACKQVPVPA